MTFEEWEVKARMLGVYDNYKIDKAPMSKLDCIGQSNNRPKYYYTLKEYNGTAKNIILPPVDRISRAAFADNKSIQSIVISEQTHVIEESAFENCLNMTTLDLSKSKVKVIPKAMCSNCKKLDKLTLNNEIDSLWAFAFAWCDSLKSLKFNDIRIVSGDCFNNSGIETLELNSKNHLMLEKNSIIYCYKLKDLIINIKGELYNDNFFIDKEGLPSIEHIKVNSKHLSKLMNACTTEYHTKISVI